MLTWRQNSDKTEKKNEKRFSLLTSQETTKCRSNKKQLLLSSFWFRSLSYKKKFCRIKCLNWCVSYFLIIAKRKFDLNWINPKSCSLWLLTLIISFYRVDRYIESNTMTCSNESIKFATEGIIGLEWRSNTFDGNSRFLKQI